MTSRVIRDRLFKEAEGNVALKVEAAPNSDAYVVSGRGELQLAILIETMRREGFELGVSRPKVLYQRDETPARLLEPIEEVVIDVDEEHSGVVVQKMSERKGEMVEMPLRRRPAAAGVPRPDAGPDRLSRRTPDRHPRHRDHEPHVPQWGAWKGDIPGRRNGV